MSVEVIYAERALVALVLQATRGVPGVVRVQQRPASALVRRLSGGRPDASAVELGRDPDGTLAVGVRIVSTLQPAPREVIAAVDAAVRAALAVVDERRVDVVVTVVDVQR